MLLESDPDTYSRPAYLPSWVAMNLAGDDVDWDHVVRPHRAQLGACRAAPPARGGRPMSESQSEARRRRWINFGELIALLALVVSAAGVWISWKHSGDDKPTQVVEQRQSIPLSLRATPDSDGSS